jgi:hypothetical protein
LPIPNFNFGSLDDNTAFSDHREDLRIQSVFLDLDTVAQSDFIILSEHRHDALGDDGPSVHALVDQMDGAAAHGRSRCQHITVCVSAGKMREERGVDVDHTALPIGEEGR